MKNHNLKSQFVICIKNDDYSVSLELRKIYQILPDIKAAEHHQIRIIDESGEDYLYPEEYFMSLKLPQAVKKYFQWEKIDESMHGTFCH